MNPPFPMLWFDTEAEAAVGLYTSLLPDSKITNITPYPEGITGRNVGDVMMVDFTLNGTRMAALNGGPDFAFSEAVSLVVECQDQAEIDRCGRR